MVPKLDLGYSATFERFNSWKANCLDFLSGNLNETETRNKIIDPLFKEVLGWNEKQITREGHLNKIGYYDYEFECDGNKFILEAKREFVPFEMPKSNTVKAQSLKNKFSELKEAIDQGVDYAVPRDINVVVVSNGTQIAITYIPYLQTTIMDTYLFQDHDKLLDNFIKFYNLFSPYNSKICETLMLLLNSGENELIRNRPAFIHKISQKQSNPADILPNNQLATFLSSIHDKYFTEIINDWELLKKCYCDYEAAHQYERNIENVLRDRAPRLGKVVDDIVSFGDETVEGEPAATSEIANIITTKKTANVFSGRFSQSRHNTKMFLLIGGAGVGKTTFIHRFFNFILSEEDKESTVWIYLDCKECANDTNLDEFVYKKIEDELFDKYQRLKLFDDTDVLLNIFSNDLNKKKALLSLIPEEQLNAERFKIINDLIKHDKDIYIKRIFEYLQKQGFSTCIVYDNVDQLDSDLQKKLFQHGNAIKDRLRTTLILSLREEVYYQHENDKSFNFSDCDVFHIPAPKILNVLSKRLKAAKDEFDDEDVLFGVKNSKGLSITLKKLEILEVLTQTFLGAQENTLLLEMLANGDVRESLRLFKRVIASPNINYDFLLSAAGNAAIKTISDKRLKYAELLRGLALDNRVHYTSTNSKIINIFEINNDGFFSHFTKLRVLLYAQSNFSLTVGTLPKGFFKLKSMYNEFFKYTVKDMDSFIGSCLSLQKEGALINLKGTISDLSEDDFISLGSSGYYYLNFLKSHPFYLALVSIDTPIANNESAERIAELYSKSLVAVEFQRNKRYFNMAQVFVNYLIESEKEELEFLRSIECPNLDSDLFKISESIKNEFESNYSIENH
ncbi:hypothetical protein J1TS5_03980 [Paenibacillus macerans]|uniref:GTPase domain-containing protein n=1 Tax=Paenibacillus macerans TaxID=44252 RepID=UPI001B05F56F|nr:GTPase domain-containing protein [Paenibacillus macerans]GIP08228.1 hypothetical protein J1TS5_03980 [Paenibacillus macerans]